MTCSPLTASTLVSLFVCAAACSGSSVRAAFPGAAHAAPRSVRVTAIEAGVPRIRVVALEEYVAAAALSEFAPPAEDAESVDEMFEVQAIIGRTYALAHLSRHRRDGFDLCATTHCQLYERSRLRSSRWAQAAVAATRRTAGVVLWYGNGPASVLFHADCGGHTSDAADVWGGAALAYLAGRPDNGPAGRAHSEWVYEMTDQALIAALNADARTRVGPRVESIVVSTRDAAGRAERVSIRGATDVSVRGETLREVLTRSFGARTIRSTRFDVQRQRGKFKFSGRGFGHGVGLCQAGALARLRAGARPKAVLQRYFPGTRRLTLS
ncbi:MAG: SpoIID/LytB domain-containing protein [Acidobacteria bacterium]|nr:SpoIID/LytB domain-containing protein [Acidobacteriota bacterium]